MTIHDEEIVALVKEQTQYFLEDAPIEKKMDVLKRIQKRQKKLMKAKEDQLCVKHSFRRCRKSFS